MKKRSEFLLILTALIWGVAFVAQSSGGDAVGPYTFNCIRNLIAFVALYPVTKLMEKVKSAEKEEKVARYDKKMQWIGGICCGCLLFVASSLQQVGITLGTEAGKAGFLTACYIILVPVLGIFLHKKCGYKIWIGVAITLVGLYLLCMTDSFGLRVSDLLLLLCALAFSIHILVVDHYSHQVDGVQMSRIQFLVCGALSAIPMLCMDIPAMGMAQWQSALGSSQAWLSILYAGVMSSGVGYTLQIVGQKGVNPTIASLLMSLESVFAVLAGAVLLGEKLSGRELFGCVLIFAAIVIAQLPETKRMMVTEE